MPSGQLSGQKIERSGGVRQRTEQAAGARGGAANERSNRTGGAPVLASSARQVGKGGSRQGGTPATNPDEAERRRSAQQHEAAGTSG